jgi:hypothetical protein
MILISHRGNLNGKFIDLENSPEYIDKAIKLGYQVEIDIWYKDEKLWLGHDFPRYEISYNWLQYRSELLWIHCKNANSLEYFYRINKNNNLFNYFWHENDLVTLTSKGFIWAYPGKQPIVDSIAVLPEIFNDETSSSLGVCSDLIVNYSA